MAGLKLLKASGLAAAFLIAAIAASGVPSQASSTVIDGPGFKVETHKGWFGRKSTSYQDAMGNGIEEKTGLFGRQSSRTSIFGTQAVKTNRTTTVIAPNGEPLVNKHKTLFNGTDTQVNANGILQSVKQIFNASPAPNSSPTP